MKKIKVSDLKVGTRFTKPVYLDGENIFLNANVPVSESDLQRLKKFGFSEVLSLGDIIDDIQTIEPNQSNNNKTKINEYTFSSESIARDPHATIVSSNALLKSIYTQIQRNQPSFNAIYHSAFEVVQSNYKKIESNKPIEIQSIREVAEELINFVKINPSFSFYLLQMNPEGYYLFNHVIYATFYTIMMGFALDYSRPKMIDLVIGSLLADVGMAKVPGAISEKPKEFTEEDWRVIKKHPLLGYQILAKINKLKNTHAIIALEHHEYFDGTGYPQKLSKGNIDEIARVHTIADNFAAMIMGRPHRAKSLPYQVMRNIISTNMHKYDVSLLKVFLNKMSMYPIGSYAELSDNTSGIILDANNNKPLRPSIIILLDAKKLRLREPRFINLTEEPNLSIIKAIEPF